MAAHLPVRQLTAAGLLALAVSLGSAGCQTYPLQREPFTTDQVIQLSNEKRPPEELIQRIRESGTVYLLRARDVKDLLDKGVDERVVDEMMATRLRDIASRSYYYPYYPYPYVYPSIGFGFSF